MLLDLSDPLDAKMVRDALMALRTRVRDRLTLYGGRPEHEDSLRNCQDDLARIRRLQDRLGEAD